MFEIVDSLSQTFSLLVLGQKGTAYYILFLIWRIQLPRWFISSEIVPFGSWRCLLESLALSRPVPPRLPQHLYASVREDVNLKQASGSVGIVHCVSAAVGH